MPSAAKLCRNGGVAQFGEFLRDEGVLIFDSHAEIIPICGTYCRQVDNTARFHELLTTARKQLKSIGDWFHARTNTAG